jgi:hypothetical protein
MFAIPVMMDFWNVANTSASVYVLAKMLNPPAQKLLRD